MPRRGGGDARSVLAILESRGLLRGWTVKALDNLSENDVGEQLRNTCIFLSLSRHEGFGLPPAEAMACGAFVIGYHGFSGREFLLPEFSSPVEPGDLLTFAQMVEAALRQENANPGWCQDKGRQASAFIHQAYSPEREREDVRDLYARFLRRAARGQERVAQA
jgi:glycosyltransferase involved in cell wall biosynthesis